MIFAYDPDKSASNRTKHGIDFEATQELWSDPRILMADLHYPLEQRYLVVGRIGDRHRTAVCTDRGDKVRIISVPRARTDEVARYDQADHG